MKSESLEPNTLDISMDAILFGGSPSRDVLLSGLKKRSTFPWAIVLGKLQKFVCFSPNWVLQWISQSNIAARHWAVEDKNLRETKNLELHYYLIREKVQDGTIKTHDIESAKNPADGFTISLDKIKLRVFCARIVVQRHD